MVPRATTPKQTHTQKPMRTVVAKALGEVNNAKDVTFRMSIIGPELKAGTGLLDWVRKNPANELPGWDNAWWNGITTLQLAKCIDRYVRNPKIAGIYHVVNNAVNINKYESIVFDQ
jgi:dTDP-4-dehydrorhamnose reductase